MANIKNHILINGAKICKATVVSNGLMKKGSCIPGTIINPTSVTFHQTACIDVDAPTMYKALNNANNDPYAGTSKSNYRKASWTITVGYNKIVQNVPLNWKAYAQGCTEGNNTSISIEMCMYTDKNKQYDTYLNAIELFKVLKREYKSSLIPKAHYDWTKKDCPQWLRAAKYGYNWTWFKNQLNAKTTTVVTEIKVNQTGSINVDVSLNVRSGPGTDNDKLGSLKDNEKVEIVAKCSNGWLKIKHNNGYGYVSGDYVDNIKDVIVSTNWVNGDYSCKVKTTANLNLRTGRGTNYKIVKTIPKGTILTLGYVLNKWGSTFDYKDGKNPTYFSCEYVEKI